MVFMRGIDVSRYQGTIDWNAVKASGVQFAVLKTVSTNPKFGGVYIDQMFERNYRECKRLGIPVGVYYYTYATTRAEADAELAMLRKALAGKKFEFPIAVDVEENTLKPLSRAALTDLVEYAAKKIESWGAFSQIYTYSYYKQTELDMDRLSKFDLWIADYHGQRPSCAHGMWQFSSKNALGVQGVKNLQSLDCNYAYRDYPKIIKGAKLNDFSDWKQPTKPTGMQTMSIGPVSAGDMARLQEAIEPVVRELKLENLYHIK